MMSKRPTKSDQRKPRQPQRRNAAQAATTMPLASAAAGATLHRIAGALEQIALSLPGGAANGDVDQSFAALSCSSPLGAAGARLRDNRA